MDDACPELGASGIGGMIKRGRVCVTGASGYLASWLVMRLLERGYSVRGTVRSLENKSKTDFLRALPNAKEGLDLIEADIMNESSLHAAVEGCDGVFALALPDSDPSTDQSALVELAMISTMNLLRACHQSRCVRRVVLTSTYFAAVQVPHDGEMPIEVDESSWTSVEYCKQHVTFSQGYMIAKTLTEKAAFDFAKENGLDVVSILPSLVGGPFLTPAPRSSAMFYLAVMTEMTEWMVSLMGYMSYVHVEDIAQAHILLMEDNNAEGRYLCSTVDATLTDVLEEVSSLLKSFNIPPPKIKVSPDKVDPSQAYYRLNTTKLKDLGFMYKYNTIYEIIKDAMLTFIEKGFLKRAEENDVEVRA